MRATMSIDGLYEYDNTIFDDMLLPTVPTGEEYREFTALTKDEVADLICMECFDLEILFPNAPMMKKAIKRWSQVECPKWQRMLNTMLIEYNPVYNVEEHIDETNKLENTHDDDTDTTHGKTVTTTAKQSVEQETKTVSFDNNTYANNTKVITTPTGSNGDTVANSGIDNVNNNGGYKNEGELHRDRYGNIGTVSASKLVLEELETAKESVYDAIVDSFKHKFCIVVY